MKVMFKKRVIAALSAALLAGSAAAVELGTGEKGEVLIAPMIMAAGGWDSELRVINTDVLNLAVVKVVFYEPGQSAEVLDFFIFLSPGDVWRGTATKNADGSIGVRSSDDSSLMVQAAGANPNCLQPTATATGFDPAVVKTTIALDFAYVNFFQARTFAGGADGTAISKASILSAYSAACLAGTEIGPTLTTLRDDTTDLLAGDVTMLNASNGNILRLNMTALPNVNNNVYHGLANYTGFSTVTSNNHIGVIKSRVEDAIWAQNYAFPYDVTGGNQTFGTVTFPTKEAILLSPATQYNPFPGSPTVALRIRDEAEQVIGVAGCQISPCPVTPGNSLPNELNVIEVRGGAGTNTPSQLFTRDFTRGWVNMSIQGVASRNRSNPLWNNFGVSGAPALATAIQWTQRGTALQGVWNYAPRTYTPGAR